MGVRVKEWKGAWWVFINHQGRRRAKRCASKKAARLAADKIDAALKLGQAGVLDAKPARVPTVAEYAESWLRAIENKVRASTAEDYRTRFRVCILPSIGTLSLSVVTRERLRAFVGEITAKGDQRTIEHRPLSRATVRGTLRSFKPFWLAPSKTG